MNYLAHLYFSAPEPLAWAGSLMGDFVKGRLSADYPEVLRSHLLLHRRIDRLTRESAAFQASRRRLDPRFRHGRSVLVDVFYDHFLAQQWQRYADLPLADFSRCVYAGLRQSSAYLPPELLQILPRMAEHDWLLSYRQEEVVDRVLSRLEIRLQGRLPLAEGGRELLRHRRQLEDDFTAFMIEAQGLVSKWHAEFASRGGTDE